MAKGKKTESLGKSLIRDKRLKTANRKNKSQLHTTDLQDGYDWAKLNLKSVTEESSLEEFLATAELAGTEFTAEINLYGAMKNQSLICDSMQPFWNEKTSKEELLTLEKETFLLWRRQLAQLQEKENIILTPYEKNIEFWRQLWRVVERSDIVVQIVDARNPYLFWCEDLETLVKEISKEKITVILLNKSDYLTPLQREMWADHFNNIGRNAIFFSALQQNNPENTEIISSSLEKINLEAQDRLLEAGKLPQTKNNFKTSPNLLTRNELLELFKNLHLESKVKGSFRTIGLVGYPNVGKSSTINALLQCKKVSVSATPGKTKHFQTLMIDSELCLCDCPGLVFPNFVSSRAEMILNGILSVDNATDPLSAVSLITDVVPEHVLRATYNLFLPTSGEGSDSHPSLTAREFLEAYGQTRGLLTGGGLPDVSRAARRVLKDFADGRLLYCRAPPGVDQKTFHPFPDAGSRIAHPQPEEKEFVRELDRNFFGKALSSVHTKDAGRQPGSTGSSSVPEGKPWKKHYNRNKKEKLRRVYAHLDQ
ncbi:large subunit GTPase 1 homolog [Centruroides sculpturatus]|uniref:large subunit GTPase 1 homolog n=2 Tax=Centruroides sculpturatus TaxID=218467 RepID=UPI000C6D0029|nr:large subunit GTPase 1 homolog [Centruroides sculpturatus]